VRSARVELILDTLKAVRGAKDLSKEVETVSDKLGDAARTGAAAGKAIDDAGDEMSDAARAAAKLDREIEQLAGSLRELAIAEALTGENFSKQIKEQEAAVGRLSRNRKLIGDIGGEGGADAAVGFAARFSQRIGPLMASLPLSSPLGVAVAGAAVSAAPLLASVIAGAVIGGAGIGGVAGGLAVASKDVRVQAAAEQLADGLEGRLERAAGAFVAPTLDGIQQIDVALDSVDIERIFQQSARFVDPLARGFASVITDMGDAIEQLIEVAGPSVAVISDGIAQIGSTGAAGLANLADNGAEAEEALRTLFEIVNFGIGTTLTLVNVLTELYGISHKLGLDTGLQLVLKLTGAEMDNTGFSAHRAGAAADGMGASFQKAADESEKLKEQQKLLKSANDAVAVSQASLQQTLDALGGKTTLAAQGSEALRQAMDNLYGAAIRNTDANEAYQASWDSLSGAVKANGRSLDIHSASGRANRDVLEQLLTSSGELYLADIAAGVATDIAAKKHRDRTAAVKEEARRLSLNKEETQRLINTYGKIPPAKTTDLILAGVASVADALLDLAAIQLHLAKGTPLSGGLARRLARSQYGMPDTKRAHGGELPGHAPHDRADNMIYSGTPGEWVIQKPTVRQVEREHGTGAMAYFNRYGELPAFASGGLLRASRTNVPRSMMFRTTAAMTHVPTMEQAIAAVPFIMGGNWPSSPAAQRGDSGVWRQIVALIRSTGPMSGTFGNAYRPGDPKWHGSGRAVDWMGFNQDGLASFLAARRPLELIHRTKNRDFAYTRGRNMGSFNESLMEAHRNHVHIAMQHGGVIPEPVFGIGRSGRSYSFAENGRPERVLSASQTAAAGTVTVHAPITINGANHSVEQLARAVSREIGRTVDIYARGAS
jgi:hypothetical protein